MGMPTATFVSCQKSLSVHHLIIAEAGNHRIYYADRDLCSLSEELVCPYLLVAEALIAMMIALFVPCQKRLSEAQLLAVDAGIDCDGDADCNCSITADCNLCTWPEELVCPPFSK